MLCPLQVTSDSYEPVGSSIDGSGFRPFDVVIPFSFRKGQITGEGEATNFSLQTRNLAFISEANRIYSVNNSRFI